MVTLPNNWWQHNRPMLSCAVENIQQRMLVKIGKSTNLGCITNLFLDVSKLVTTWSLLLKCGHRCNIGHVLNNLHIYTAKWLWLSSLKNVSCTTAKPDGWALAEGLLAAICYLFPHEVPQRSVNLFKLLETDLNPKASDWKTRMLPSVIQLTSDTGWHGGAVAQRQRHRFDPDYMCCLYGVCMFFPWPAWVFPGSSSCLLTYRFVD